ncbi:GIY-YIG nuclease family protein [Desulfosporosinus sp.]|uniref:GIY-YIG nuclease family protein n=1 Tax=Desulfosporosinus sp. TaxID=157907 RepID=UPI0023119C6C|nr:GIY-YIG nuclease family protein [Desulfosporosinus sp.]MCO5384517.1 GIY-YIG nuclease family protein [Desulfosporosinus sp.]MDA8220637.1 GIY-YIG nuclease family protein [Desulfitobacterium hafniense]
MTFNYEPRQLPEKPGVYMMIDSLGNIIYVGKAKNLKNRVSQYFNNQKNRTPKVVEMIHHIHTLKYIVTDTELDAFIEECRLIKEIKPRYNKQMKNDKKYCYIKIMAERYPKVTIVNEKIDDDALYFGPFTSLRRVETVLHYLKDFYPIRKCSTPRLVKRTDGCLFLQLGTCLGVCTGRVSPDEYKVYIEEIRQLLNGNDRIAVQELSEKIDTAIENLNFEKAAQYSAYLLGLRHVIGKQRLVRSSSKNRNVLAVEFINNELAKLFLIKGNKILYRKVINIVTADISELRQNLNQIIRDIFMTENSGIVRLTQNDIDEAQIIYSYLKKNRSRIPSFWISSTRLNRETSGLDATVLKIINRITSEIY